MTVSIDPILFNELEETRETIPRSVIVTDAITTYLKEIKEEMN